MKLKWMIILGILPITVMASFQVASPKKMSSLTNPYKISKEGVTRFPKTYEDNYIFHIRKGSLKVNIRKAAAKYHWQMNWRPKHRHLVLNNNTIAGPTFCKTMEELVSHYPLQVRCNRALKKITIYNPVATKKISHPYKKAYLNNIYKK